MPKIRSRGEGSISRRDNGTWLAQISLDGRRISKTFRTQQACKDWLRSKRNQIERGLTFQGAHTRLGDFLRQWLIIVKPSLRGSTWMHYERMVRLYLLPGLGDPTKLSDLKPELVQQSYNRLLVDGVGVSTVRYVHVVLRIALSHAVNLQLIATNPTDATIPPAEPKREMRCYDEAQANRFLFSSRGHRLEALFYLAVTTGMRQSELLGLRWTDLDWIRRTLRIERQLARGTEGYQLVELKTMYSRRTIEIGEIAIAKLRERQEMERYERAISWDRWTENQLIFPSRIGTPLDHRGLGRQFKQLTSNAGLPEIRFHDLRHTAASLMLNHGVPVITASRILGHSRPSITMDMYGHLLPGQQGEVAALMDRLVASVEVQLSAPPDPTAT